MPDPKPFTTQATLASTLAGIFRDAWKGDEIVVPGSRRRWDMAYSDGTNTVVVEYDGDEHYRHSIKIKVDQEKDSAAAARGYKVVRFPYWVQLDTTTLMHYFGVTRDLPTDFPHGFITTKHFPASFCELGIARFRTELASLPTIVSSAVVSSLRARAEEYGLEYVLPTPLRYLVAA